MFARPLVELPVAWPDVKEEDPAEDDEVDEEEEEDVKNLGICLTTVFNMLQRVTY